MSSPRYILTFILILTAISAVLLTGLRELTKEISEQNEDIFNKRAILSALNDHLEKDVEQLKDGEVLDIFSSRIEQVSLNLKGEELESVMAEDIDMAKERKKPESERMLPLYIYDENGEKYYILSVRGNGLWDEIWGNIAFESDLNTITGAAFDHKGETPGLGAEIKDNPGFAAKFKGKKVYDDKGGFVSVSVEKRAKDPNHEVDGITGATITCDGVSDMLYKGIKYYEPFIEKLKQESM
ncbi:MAG: NADH:ubiquinone reductase (Na(+)-transporting) subunit C [Bacteroidetes bacterium]|nr:NADH:ubiquinone reductase (Na(+)-transporting) subunit C [Bacteroidota bacterium]